MTHTHPHFGRLATTFASENREEVVVDRPKSKTGGSR